AARPRRRGRQRDPEQQQPERDRRYRDPGDRADPRVGVGPRGLRGLVAGRDDGGRGRLDIRRARRRARDRRRGHRALRRVCGDTRRAMTTYAPLQDLSLEVEAYELEGLARDVSSAFTRRTTIVRLRGGGEEGVGEDVTYNGQLHDAAQAAG